MNVYVHFQFNLLHISILYITYDFDTEKKRTLSLSRLGRQQSQHEPLLFSQLKGNGNVAEWHSYSVIFPDHSINIQLTEWQSFILRMFLRLVCPIIHIQTNQSLLRTRASLSLSRSIKLNNKYCRNIYCLLLSARLCRLVWVISNVAYFTFRMFPLKNLNPIFRRFSSIRPFRKCVLIECRHSIYTLVKRCRLVWALIFVCLKYKKSF